MVNNDDFFNAIIRDITMVRGDTLSFNFQLEGLEGVAPAALTFTCKADHEDDDVDALFTCSIGDGITQEAYDTETDTYTYTLRVAPAKTENLDLSRYYYDLQMRAGNDVITLMIGRLTLSYDVTRG